MLRFNFFLWSKLRFPVWWSTVIHMVSLEQRKTKIEPRKGLNLIATSSYYWQGYLTEIEGKGTYQQHCIYFLCLLVNSCSFNFSAPAPDDEQNFPLGRSGRILNSFTFVILQFDLIDFVPCNINNCSVRL